MVISLLLIFLSLFSIHAMAQAVDYVCSFSPHPFASLPSTCPPLINTSNASSPHAPWSLPPVCIDASGEDDQGPRYCVYTDRTFRGGRGLSVLATPEVAANVASHLNDGIIPNHLLEHPTSPMRASGISAEWAVAVRDVPGRGKGVVATRRIRAGERVIVDFPVMITQNEFPGLSNREDLLELLHLSVDQLSHEQQREVLELAHDEDGDVIQGILKTNAFGGLPVSDQHHIGLFGLASVSMPADCNGTTRADGIAEGESLLQTIVSSLGEAFVHWLAWLTPNSSYWRYDPVTMVQEVIALRDIEPGEEISHSCS
jgi:hypothetical protein